MTYIFHNAGSNSILKAIYVTQQNTILVELGSNCSFDVPNEILQLKPAITLITNLIMKYTFSKEIGIFSHENPHTTIPPPHFAQTWTAPSLFSNSIYSINSINTLLNFIFEGNIMKKPLDDFTKVIRINGLCVHST